MSQLNDYDDEISLRTRRTKNHFKCRRGIKKSHPCTRSHRTYHFVKQTHRDMKDDESFEHVYCIRLKHGLLEFGEYEYPFPFPDWWWDDYEEPDYDF